MAIYDIQYFIKNYINRVLLTEQDFNPRLQRACIPSSCITVLQYHSIRQPNSQAIAFGGQVTPLLHSDSYRNSTNQPINQSTNQPINQSTNQPIH